MWYWQKACRLSHFVLTGSTCICTLTCPCKARRRAGPGGAMKVSVSNPKRALRRLAPPQVSVVGTEALARVPKHGEPLELHWWLHTSSQHQTGTAPEGNKPRAGNKPQQTKWSDSQDFSHLCGKLTPWEPRIPQAWQDVWHIDACILNLHLYSTRPIN